MLVPSTLTGTVATCGETSHQTATDTTGGSGWTQRHCMETHLDLLGSTANFNYGVPLAPQEKENKTPEKEKVTQRSTYL